MTAPRTNRGRSHFLRVGQVAAMLDVHPNTVRRWTEQGLLNASRMGTGGHRRFDRADVERLKGGNGA